MDSSKKRKCNDSDANDDTPLPKKRKLNLESVTKTLNNFVVLLQENKALIRQLKVVKKERDLYKTKFAKLLSIVREHESITNRSAAQNHTDTNDAYSTNTNTHNTRTTDTEISQTHNSEPVSILKSVIPSKDNATWQNTHYFTADCHFCNKSFDNQQIYISHLRDSHYKSEWMQCQVKRCRFTTKTDMFFISHIFTHLKTNSKLYNCKVKQNGEFCNFSSNYCRSLQNHINNKHYNKQFIVKYAKKYQFTESDSESESEAESSTKVSDLRKTIRFKRKTNNFVNKTRAQTRSQTNKR